MVEALHPFVLCDESDVEATALRMAGAFGFEHLVQVPRAERIDGSTCAAAADAGIPAIIAEAGGRGLLEQPTVDLLAGGVRSVLRELGMLSGEPSPAPSRTLCRRFAWLYAPEAGWWRSDVQPGDDVLAGQRLGAIEDLFGDERACDHGARGRHGALHDVRARRRPQRHPLRARHAARVRLMDAGPRRRKPNAPPGSSDGVPLCESVSVSPGGTARPLRGRRGSAVL